MFDKNNAQDPSQGILLLYVEIKDSVTGDEVDQRVGLLSGDRGTVIAESYGEETSSPLSRDDVEVIAYNLCHGVGLKERSVSVSITNDFPQGSFEWELALSALREQEEKASITTDEKLQRIMDGEAVVADDEWLDSVDLPSGVTSIPNPGRVGLRDVYLVGKNDNPAIHEWRVKNGIVEPAIVPEKKPKIGM